MKRLFDLTLAAIGIIVLSPLFVWIALLIKFDSPRGRILYRSQRIGRHGKPFWLLKFRTMVHNADAIGGPSTPDDDPRVTRIGRFLRKHKLDELPQLLNVLKGDMSFVGPRPEVPQYAALLTKEESVILSVRPGITDWASLWDCDEGALLAGGADPEQTYLEQIRPKKLALQLAYVKTRTFRTDLVILLQTAALIVFRSKRFPLGSLKRDTFLHGNQFD